MVLADIFGLVVPSKFDFVLLHHGLDKRGD